MALGVCAPDGLLLATSAPTDTTATGPDKLSFAWSKLPAMDTTPSTVPVSILRSSLPDCTSRSTALSACLRCPLALGASCTPILPLPLSTSGSTCSVSMLRSLLPSTGRATLSSRLSMVCDLTSLITSDTAREPARRACMHIRC